MTHTHTGHGCGQKRPDLAYRLYCVCLCWVVHTIFFSESNTTHSMKPRLCVRVCCSPFVLTFVASWTAVCVCAQLNDQLTMCPFLCWTRWALIYSHDRETVCRNSFGNLVGLFSHSFVRTKSPQTTHSKRKFTFSARPHSLKVKSSLLLIKHDFSAAKRLIADFNLRPFLGFIYNRFHSTRAFIVCTNFFFVSISFDFIFCCPIQATDVQRFALISRQHFSPISVLEEEEEEERAWFHDRVAI